MLADIERKVTAMMSHEKYVDVGLGLRRYAPWLDFGKLFSYTLCNTDSTIPYQVDFNIPRITLCANFIVKDEDIQKEVTTSLVILYDHLRNKGPWKTCDQFACTVARSLVLSNRCPNPSTRGTCLLKAMYKEMQDFPLCQQKSIPREAEEAFSRCYLDRSPFGLL